MSPRERELRLLSAAQGLLNYPPGPVAILREAMEGKPNCGMWLTRDVNYATCWLAHNSGLKDPSIQELRSAVANIRRQAALN